MVDRQKPTCPRQYTTSSPSFGFIITDYSLVVQDSFGKWFSIFIFILEFDCFSLKQYGFFISNRNKKFKLPAMGNGLHLSYSQNRLALGILHTEDLHTLLDFNQNRILI